VYLVGLTCVLSIAVNASNYMVRSIRLPAEPRLPCERHRLSFVAQVLGKTSPLTYQVVGHAKTVLVRASLARERPAP
jgi:hypothetical protein